MPLIAEQLSALRGDRCLFAGLSFSLSAGELLHITGPNGRGKTTLLRGIAGLGRLDAGQLRWEQAEPAAKFAQQLEADGKVSSLWLGHHNGINAVLTPTEQLRYEQQLYGLYQRDESEEEIDQALVELGLLAVAENPCSSLSAGQQRRVALCRLRLRKARLWLLDEPYVSLDTAGRDWLDACLQQHLSIGGMVILTSHHALSLNQVTTRSLALEAPAC